LNAKEVIIGDGEMRKRYILCFNPKEAKRQRKLSLLIERVAEIACQQPWSQIRRKLQTLQVTEFLTLKHRFYRRNELTPEVSQTLKALAVAAPKSILAVENLS